MTDAPRGTIGHRKGSAISKPIPLSPQDQMVGVTLAELIVAYGQLPPETSSSELSLSASFPGVEEILFGAPSFTLSPGSACPFEFVSCALVIFNLHVSSMLIGARHCNPALTACPLFQEWVERTCLYRD